MKSSLHYFLSGWCLLLTLLLTQQAWAQITTTTDYEYSAGHLQVIKERTPQSDGSVLETQYTYPPDYTSSPYTALAALVTQNILSPVIQKKVIREVGSSRQIISAQITTYKLWTVGGKQVPLPYKIYSLLAHTPLSEGSFSNYPGNVADFTTIGSNTTYQLEVEYTDYDEKGNLLSMLSKGSQRTSYLWGYSGQYPIAEIQNASKAQVDAALSTAGTSRTELFSLTNESQLQAKLIAIQNALLSNQALLKGYTYKVGIGLSSQVDVMGKITAYQYDNLSRLESIRENNSSGNLLQSFGYHYKGQGLNASTTISSAPGITALANPSLIGGNCPTPVITASPSSLSSAGTTQLTVSNYQAGSSVTWKTATGTTFPAVTSANYTANVTTTTTYTATYTLNGCTSSTSNSVTVTVGASTGKLQVTLASITGQPTTKKRVTVTNPNAGNRTYTWYVYEGASGYKGIGPNQTSSTGSFDVDLSSFNLTPGTEYRLWVGDTGEPDNSRHNYAVFTHAAPTYERVLVLGNSITKITWDPSQNGDGWGMSASTREKDFAHLLQGYLKTKSSTARVVPTYIAKFEYRSGWNSAYTMNLQGQPAPQLAFNYDTLQTLVQQNFASTKPDLVILRVVENVDDSKVNAHQFKQGYQQLINKAKEVAPGATILLTTSFWEKNLQADAKIRELASEMALPLVDLADMRYYPQFKAAHDQATQNIFPSIDYGFNEHPGDLGMKEIADRIWAKLQGTTYTPTAVKPTAGAAWAKVKSPLTNARVKGQVNNGLLTMDLEFEIKVPATSHVGQVEVMASFADATSSFASVKGIAMADPSNPNIFRLSKTISTSSGKWSGGALYPNAYKFWARVLGLNETSNRFTFNSDTVTVDLSAQTETCTTRGASINSATTVAGTKVSGQNTYTIPFALSVCLPKETKGDVELWASLTNGSWPAKIAVAQSRNGSTTTFDVQNSSGTNPGQWLNQGLDAGSYKFWIVVKSPTGTGTLLETTPVTITIQGDGTATPTCSTAVIRITSPATNTNQPGTQQTRSDGSKGYTMPLAMEVCLPAGESVSKVEFFASLTNGNFESKIGTGLKSATDAKIYNLSATMGTAAGQWSGIAFDPNTYKFYARVTKTNQEVVTTPAVTIDLSGSPTSGCSTASAAITSGASIAGNLVSGTTDVYTIPLTLTACLPGESKGNVEVWVSLTNGDYARRLGTAASVNFSTVNFSIASALNQGGLGAWDAASGGLYAGSYLFWVKVMKADGSLGVESPKKTITITGATTGNNCSTPTVTVLSPANNTQVTGSLQTRADGSKGVTTPLSFNVCLPAGQTVSKVEVYARLTNGNFPNKMGTAINSSSAPNTYVLSATMGTAAGQWSGIALDPNTYQFYAIVTKNDQTTLQSNVVTIDLSGVSTASCTSNNAAITSNASITGNLVSGTTDVYTIPLTLTACLPGQTKGNLEVWVSLPDGGYARKVGNAVSVGGSSGSYQILSTLNTGGNGAWDAASGGLYAGTYLFWVKVMKADGSLGVESPKKTIAITPSTTSTSCATPTVNWISPATTNFHTGTLDNRSNGTKGVTIPVSVEVCLPSGQSVSSVEIWASMTNDNWARKVGTAVKGSGNTYTMSANLGSSAGQWLSSAGSLDPNTYKFWAVVNRGGGLTTLTSIKQAITIAAVASTTCSSISLEWHGPPANTPRVGTLVSGTTNAYTIPFQVGVCLPGESITGVEIWASTMDGGWPRRLGNATASGGSSSVYRLEVGTNSGGIGQWDATAGGLNPASYKFWAVLKRADGSQAATTQTTPTVITITTPSGGRQGVVSTSLEDK